MATSLEERLLSFLEETDVELPNDLSAETSLIRSGLLDSLALFELFQQIESEVGAPIDVTSIDLATEWDTVRDIAKFILRHRGR